MNMQVQVFMYVFNSPGHVSRRRIVRSHVPWRLIFKELPNSFPKKLHHFTFPPAMCHPAEWRCQLNLSRTAGRDGTHRKHHKGGPRCCISAPHFTCLWQSTWHAGEHGVSFQIFYPPHLFSSGKRVHVHDLWLQWTFYSGFFCELWFSVISSFNRHFVYILFYNHNCNNYLKITVYLNGSWVSLPIPSYSDLSIHGLLFWFISQLLEHGACLIVIFFFFLQECVWVQQKPHTQCILARLKWISITIKCELKLGWVWNPWVTNPFPSRLNGTGAADKPEPSLGSFLWFKGSFLYSWN